MDLYKTNLCLKTLKWSIIIRAVCCFYPCMDYITILLLGLIILLPSHCKYLVGLRATHPVHIIVLITPVKGVECHPLIVTLYCYWLSLFMDCYYIIIYFIIFSLAYSERRADDNPIVCVGVGQPQRRRPVRHQHPGSHTHRTLQHVRPRLVQRRVARRKHLVPDRGLGSRG